MSKFKSFTDNVLNNKFWHVVLEPDVELVHTEYDGLCNGKRIELGIIEMFDTNSHVLTIWFYEGTPQIGQIIELDGEDTRLIIKDLRNTSTVIMGVYNG